MPAFIEHGARTAICVVVTCGRCHCCGFVGIFVGFWCGFFGRYLWEQNQKPHVLMSAGNITHPSTTVHRSGFIAVSLLRGRDSHTLVDQRSEY